MSYLFKYTYNEDGVPQFHTGCDHPLVESASDTEVAAVAFADFPSDEDVEVAKRAFVKAFSAGGDGMRAALQAVADTRRTEEEG